MKIAEALKQVHELQILIGQKPPTINSVIKDIIPAPKDDTFDSYLNMYLKYGDIDETIRQHSTSDFEILLIFKSSSGATIATEWYDNRRQQPCS